MAAKAEVAQHNMFPRKESLSRSKILEINQALIDIFYHPLGGDVIKGSVLATLYEKNYGVGDHGFDDNKWYKLHVAESPRGWYVLTNEVENPNVITEETK